MNPSSYISTMETVAYTMQAKQALATMTPTASAVADTIPIIPII